MKILVVQESDWLKRNPHQQHHLMDRMSIRGHEVRVIDYPIDWPKDDNDGFKFEREVVDNVYKIDERASVQVIRPGFIKKPVLNYISLYYSHKNEIKYQIENFKPDVIVSLGLLNAYAASKLAKKYNIPHVYYLIDVLYALIPEKTFQSFGKYINKKAIKNSTKVITINQKLSELAVKLGASKEETILIDAGIDFNSYDPNLDSSSIKQEYNIKDDDIVLFFMGFIYDFAGMKELAIKLAQERDNYPHYKLLIVGDGDAYEDLLQIQKDYNLQDQLILTGRQSFERIPEFLSSASFCLLPAYIDEEIMQHIVPIKIYEYLAMEKVVIASELPGISTEFGYNHGVEYVHEASEVLAKAESIIQSGKYDEIAKTGREYVKDNDWEVITDKFEKVLEDLIK